MYKHFVASTIVLLTTISAQLSISQTLEQAGVPGQMSAIINGLPKEALGRGPSDRGGGDKKLFDIALGIAKDKDLETDIRDEIYKRFTEDQMFLAGLAKRKIESGKLKERFLSLLRNPRFIAEMRNSEAKRTLEKLLNDGLIEDVEQSPYTVKPECIDDDGRSKFLTTENGTASTRPENKEICINPHQFYTYYKPANSLLKLVDVGYTFKVEPTNTYFTYLPIWQLFGLFMHDHARHFGVKDENHSFAVELAKAAYTFDYIYDGSRLNSIKPESAFHYVIKIPVSSPCGQVSDSNRFFNSIRGEVAFVPKEIIKKDDEFITYKIQGGFVRTLVCYASYTLFFTYPMQGAKAFIYRSATNSLIGEIPVLYEHNKYLSLSTSLVNKKFNGESNALEYDVDIGWINYKDLKVTNEPNEIKY